MATTNPSQTSVGAPRGGAAPLFGTFLILWILFAAALLFNQGALDSVWNWLTGPPLILQVLTWILFLPITLGLWIWETDWALWLRLLLIFMIGVGNLTAFRPRNGGRAQVTSRDSAAGGDQAAPLHGMRG
ncbi:MAG TPA: hypothetical protein VF221_03965 [Chloroflexota bacterium]